MKSSHVSAPVPPEVLKPVLHEKIERLSAYKGSEEVLIEALREHQARRHGLEVVMTPELERLLDEGLEDLDQAKTTDALRRQS